MRLPKEFRFEGDEVLIYREGGHVVLQPKQSNWESFFLDVRHVLTTLCVRVRIHRRNQGICSDVHAGHGHLQLHHP